MPCLRHIASNLTRRCSNAVCLNCAWHHEITVLTLSTMAGKYLNRLGHMADMEMKDRYSLIEQSLCSVLPSIYNNIGHTYLNTTNYIMAWLYY